MLCDCFHGNSSCGSTNTGWSFAHVQISTNQSDCGSNISSLNTAVCHWTIPGIYTCTAGVYSLYPIPCAPCPLPHAPYPVPHAPYPVSHPLCPMPPLYNVCALYMPVPTPFICQSILHPSSVQRDTPTPLPVLAACLTPGGVTVAHTSAVKPCVETLVSGVEGGWRGEW